jgi:tRNA/tmRNA/rRNA uracil-C5-methylase (TrmA/RlmC/RlmD family)
MTAASICPHFGICGGCAHQDVPYERQLLAKEQRVRAALAEAPVATFHPILASPQTLFYRNKMEYSFGDERDLAILERRAPPVDGGRVHVGLHPKGRFALVTPTPECGLESEASRVILRTVAAWANERRVSIYVRLTNLGDLRHVVIREGKNTGERLVNVVAKSTTPHVPELAERLKACGVEITTFLWSRYDGLSDVAHSTDQQIFWGEGAIQEKLAGAVLRVNANSFMQTNTRAAEGMIAVLKNWIALSFDAIPSVAAMSALSTVPSPLAGPTEAGREGQGEGFFSWGAWFHPLTPALSRKGRGRMTFRGSTLIDLYCGSGAIGLSLATEFESVIGVELNPSAIQDALLNAEVSQTPNIRFIEGKAEDVAATLPVKDRSENTTVIVDPPRPGLHPAMTQTLLDWSVPWLFYVSCNPESLARDLRTLRGRYDILDVQPMDFFPHTDHIETAVRLRRRETNP